MKIKNLYLILLAIVFIASSCSENSDLDPIQLQQEILSQEIDDQRSQWSYEWGDCPDGAGEGCDVIATWQDPGAYIVVDAGSSGGSGSSGGIGDLGAGETYDKTKKFKGNKPLVDYSYFTANGYNSTEMGNFQLAFQLKMSNSEWKIYFEDLDKAQRSCYVLNARIAIDKANQFFPGFKRNSKGDALRQGIASALNAHCLGVTLIKQLQDAHYTRSIYPYHTKEIEMMQHNDAFGRSLIIPWAPPSSTTTLINQVIYARANGGLVYLTPLTNDRPNSSTMKVTTADNPGGPGPGDDCDDGNGSAGGVVGMC